MGPTKGSFAQRLFQARLAYSARKGRQVTQAELAELAGVSTAAWSTWEAGRSVPPLDTISRLAGLLGVTAAYLAFGEEKLVAEKDSHFEKLPRPATKKRQTGS